MERTEKSSESIHSSSQNMNSKAGRISQVEYGDLVGLQDDIAAVESASKKTQNVYESMSRKATLRAAAVEIARPSFPREERLPRIAELPFLHSGNSILFDYQLYGKILWTLALRIRKQRAPSRGIIFVVVGCSVLMLIAVVKYLHPSWYSLALPGVFFFFSVVVRQIHRGQQRQESKLKASYLEPLLKNEIPPIEDPVQEPNIGWIEGSHGQIEAGNIPVLVALDGKKFPGFGRVQIQQLLVCPPKKTDAKSQWVEPTPGSKSASESLISTSIKNVIVNCVKQSHFNNISMGNVVVIDGGSISNDSAWLDPMGKPRCTIPVSALSTILQDPVPARVYFAIRILFPNHMTAATLFVRSYSAAHAVAVELNLLTLGPIAHHEPYLHQRLLQLQSQSFGRQQSKVSIFSRLFGSSRSRYVDELNRFYMGATVKFEPMASLRKPSRVPDPDDRNEQTELRRAAKKLSPLLSHWIGNWAGLPHGREHISLAFTSDYFGNAESRATIRNLYESVTASILDELDYRGYDIRNYRDQEGRLNIQAEKIDSLVVGDRVIFEGESNRAPHHEQRTSPASAAASTTNVRSKSSNLSSSVSVGSV